jgi:hypothetical protein
MKRWANLAFGSFGPISMLNRSENLIVNSTGREIAAVDIIVSISIIVIIPPSG